MLVYAPLISLNSSYSGHDWKSEQEMVCPAAAIMLK